MSSVSPLLQASMRHARLIENLKATCPGFGLSSARLNEAVADFVPIWEAFDPAEKALASQYIAGMIVEAIQGMTIFTRHHEPLAGREAG